MDTIKQLELLFRQPDAVMEPGIFDKIKTYVAAGGNAPNAVQDLSDGYQGAYLPGWTVQQSWHSSAWFPLADHIEFLCWPGYGPMSSLVVEWTRQLAGRAPPAISSEPVRDEVFFLSVCSFWHFPSVSFAGLLLCLLHHVRLALPLQRA